MSSLSRTQDAVSVPYVLSPSAMREYIKSLEMTDVPISVGIYCRLSKDDGTNGESISIENQKVYLEHYARDRDWNVFDIYIDDGVTGTTFERDDLRRLIRDCESGLVNTVLVKDLSRFGRNSSKMDEMEEYFRRNNIRFIAVQDNVDSANGEVDSLLIKVKNIFNEDHVAQTSRKSKQARRTGAEQGKFLGSYPPFGYRKHPENKYLLIPSEDAQYVEEIFRRMNIGDSMRMIADDFNERQIITPSMRIAKDYGGTKRTPSSPVWISSAIGRILDNAVYLGHLVQCKRKTVSHKDKTRVNVPFSQQAFVKNTHEAIISADLWNSVQERRANARRGVCPQKKNGKGVNLFSGFVFCADCGYALAATTKRSKSEEYSVLRCSKYNNAGKSACSSHIIREDALSAVLLNDIKMHTSLAESDENLLVKSLHEMIFAGQLTEQQRRDNQISKLKSELENLTAKIEKLFEEKWSGSIPEDIF